MTVKRDCSIPSGGVNSDAIELFNFYPVRVQLPTMTGTAVTPQTSSDGGATFADMYDRDGVVLSFVPGRSYAVELLDWAGIEFLRFVSGTTEGADCTIYVMLED